MRVKGNESGGALLMVLMLVVVFTVLGMGLLTMNISAAKQFDKKEEQVQARHQAEMGVLHFQNQLKEMVKVHNEELENIAKSDVVDKVARIAEENEKFCNEMNSTNNALSSTEEYNYKVTYQGETDCLSAREVIVTIESEGRAGKNGKSNIEAKITLNMPDNTHISDGGNEEGTPSEPPVTGLIVETWPCNEQNKNNCSGTFENYTKVNDVEMKKGYLLFKDHLVADSIKIDGGNGAAITVAKDLYIKDLFYIQNQSCIVIQGDFTVQKKIHIQSNGQIFIYVYGDIFLPNKPEKGKLFVNGNVYFNGEKQVENPFDPIPIGNKHGNCILTGPPTNNHDPSIPEINEWEFEDGIEADYKS